MTDLPAPAHRQLVQVLAARVRDAGLEIGLPFVAVSADIGDPGAMRGADGRPFAETLFRWFDPQVEYWKDRRFALRSAFVFASRYTAEPFYFCDGTFASWRPSPRLEGIDMRGFAEHPSVGTAVVAPTHLPGGIIGAVVWASPDAFDIRQVFEQEAANLHALALKLLGAYNEPAISGRALVHLTRREVQCLKWAAAGKTNVEIAQIVGISTPTVRFHMRNAAEKLEVSGRSQAVHVAGVLGYVGEPKSSREPRLSAAARSQRRAQRRAGEPDVILATPGASAGVPLGNAPSYRVPGLEGLAPLRVSGTIDGRSAVGATRHQLGTTVRQNVVRQDVVVNFDGNGMDSGLVVRDAAQAPEVATGAFRAALVDLNLSQRALAAKMQALGDQRSFDTILRAVQRMATGEARVSGEMQVVMTQLARERRRAKRLANSIAWRDEAGFIRAEVSGVALSITPQANGRWHVQARVAAPSGFSPPIPHWCNSLEEAKLRAVLCVDEVLDQLEAIDGSEL